MKTVRRRYSLAMVARPATVINFAVGFEVIAGLTLLAVALGALRRKIRSRSRETRSGRRETVAMGGWA